VIISYGRFSGVAVSTGENSEGDDIGPNNASASYLIPQEVY